MSTEQTKNLPEIPSAAALVSEAPRKYGATFILAWRMDTSEDLLYKGLGDCGCGFCPDDDQRTT